MKIHSIGLLESGCWHRDVIRSLQGSPKHAYLEKKTMKLVRLKASPSDLMGFFLHDHMYVYLEINSMRLIPQISMYL